MRMPLGSSHFIDFETEIVAQDVPVIFGLDQRHKHGCSSDDYDHTFTPHLSRTTIPVKYKKLHLYVEWPISEVLYKTFELEKLHELFGHPNSRFLINLLNKAQKLDCTKETMNIIRIIASSCKTCQNYALKAV